ncbi:matrixin family metalloprotease [Patescibacteria group bacterium]|nr:matrixin family metalloprotease [Patescibacteria group bacterium]
MKAVRSTVLYGMLAISIGVLWNTALQTPCSRVVKYDIGEFDERFGITKELFLAQIEHAEQPWETVAQRELFQYVPGSDFMVNLIWSDEQERLYEGNTLQNQLDTKQERIDTVQTRYQSAVSRYERSVREYEARLNAYEADVSYWNAQGGAPEGTYQELQVESSALESKASEVNRLLAQVNAIAEENNERVEEYNEGVATYNDLFSQAHEFDAGNTDGTEINVYSYDGNQELQTLLIHEFGHVLGIDHVDDPASVMYYLLNDENHDGVLSDVDITALTERCRL